jgi:hypothetical protein
LFAETRELIRVLAENGVLVYGLHISYTPGEHLHAWIHTHNPSQSAIVDQHLATPLYNDDPFVKQGADAKIGTKYPKPLEHLLSSPAHYKDGGRDTKPWQGDMRIETKTNQMRKEVGQFLERVDQQKFYLFWYASAPDDLMISFPSKK